VADKLNPARHAIPDLGKTPATLLRQLGIFSATALVISNMIGTGIFTTTGFLAGDLGDPRLVLGIWVVGALVALAGALCYSELGINFPSSGGEYVYLTRAYGPTWGFMTGWVSFFAGFSAPIAAASLACARYLGGVQETVRHGVGNGGADWVLVRRLAGCLPDLKGTWMALDLGWGHFQLQFGPSQLVAAALIAVLTAVNIFGVRRVGKLQNLLTGVNLTVILAFIALGLFAGTGTWTHFSESVTRTSTGPVAAQFAISLFWIYVCYSGWNAATYVAEELKVPERTLPMALTFGTLLVAAIYVALNVVFLYALPLAGMQGADGKPIVEIGLTAATALFGPAMGGLFGALIALCLVATVNAEVTVGPRVYYAMAQNRAFFKMAAHVHPRWRTPVIAILCQGLCAALMTLTPFPDLVVYIGFSLTFFAVLSVASLFIFRRRPNWQRQRSVSFAWPLIPLVFILVGGWTIVYGIMHRPGVSVAAILTIGAGAAIYHARIKQA
jgi:APA family basic amino acid/polyamine antiporter